MEPHLPPVVQQQEEAGSPHPHWPTCPAPSSSEDEFFDCLQESEATTQETTLSRVQNSPTTHRQTLTGTSVSTQV